MLRLLVKKNSEAAFELQLSHLESYAWLSMSVMDKGRLSCNICALHLLSCLWNPEQDTDGTVRIIATGDSSKIWENSSVFYQKRRKWYDRGAESGEETTSCFLASPEGEKGMILIIAYIHITWQFTRHLYSLFHLILIRGQIWMQYAHIRIRKLGSGEKKNYLLKVWLQRGDKI